MHGHSKVFTGDMRGAKKAAKEIIRLLPDIERAGATYFEFLIGGDGRRPFASAQILDVNDEPVSLPVKLGNS